MSIEYKNPEKRDGIFVWEADVKFFPKSSVSSMANSLAEEKVTAKESDGIFCYSSQKEDNFLMWASEIKNWESQKVISLNWSSPKKKFYEEDENKNIINIFDFSKKIIGRSQLKATFSCEVSEIKVDFNSITNRDYNKSSFLYQKQTKTERFLSQTEEIVAMARSITDGTNNYIMQAKKIYQWIIENIKLREGGKERGVIRTFQSREGNVGEISFLFTTLMRAVGIPTRIVAGEYGEKEKKQDFHFWNEFYLEGVGWIPVDCAKKLFGELDNKRIIFSKGENILLERAPESGDAFGINYKRAFFLQPEVFYVDKKESGVFAIKTNKYILIK